MAWKHDILNVTMVVSQPLNLKVTLNSLTFVDEIQTLSNFINEGPWPQCSWDNQLLVEHAIAHCAQVFTNPTKLALN